VEAMRIGASNLASLGEDGSPQEAGRGRSGEGAEEVDPCAAKLP